MICSMGLWVHTSDSAQVLEFTQSILLWDSIHTQGGLDGAFSHGPSSVRQETRSQTGQKTPDAGLSIVTAPRMDE